MTAPTIQPDTIRIGRSRFPFTGFAEAASAYRATIENMGLGASQTPKCLLFRDGRVVGYVSYNGRVWAGQPEDWKSGDAPIYDPFAR